MSDVKVTPIRPADQSCLATAKGLAPYRPAVSVTHTGQVKDFRVSAVNVLTGRVELETVTANGTKIDVLTGLPPRLVGRFVANFSDDRTRKEG